MPTSAFARRARDLLKAVTTQTLELFCTIEGRSNTTARVLEDGNVHDNCEASAARLTLDSEPGVVAGITRHPAIPNQPVTAVGG